MYDIYNQKFLEQQNIGDSWSSAGRETQNGKLLKDIMLTCHDELRIINITSASNKKTPLYLLMKDQFSYIFTVTYDLQEIKKITKYSYKKAFTVTITHKMQNEILPKHISELSLIYDKTYQAIVTFGGTLHTGDKFEDKNECDHVYIYYIKECTVLKKQLVLPKKLYDCVAIRGRHQNYSVFSKHCKI